MGSRTPFFFSLLIFVLCLVISVPAQEFKKPDTSVTLGCFWVGTDSSGHVDSPDKMWAPDKAKHAMTTLMATVFMVKTLQEQTGLNHASRRYISAGFTLSLGISKEMWDGQKPGNHFSWRDLFADAVGITLGWILVNQP